jgi:molybdopterin-guanine dinucleotide biosynthesis protein A
MPDLDISLAHRMLGLARGREIVVPRSAGGLPEPLFAVYRKSVASKANHLLASGERRIRPLFNLCRTGYVDLEDGEEVLNLNTREDLAAYVGETINIV